MQFDVHGRSCNLQRKWSRRPCVQVAVKLLHESGDDGAMRREALLFGSTVSPALRHLRSGPKELSAGLASMMTLC